MNTDDNNTPRGDEPPAFGLKPLASITNMLGRGRWSVKHHGAGLGEMFIEALAEMVERLRALLRGNAAAAASVETEAGKLIVLTQECAADGVIDAQEKRRLGQRCGAFLRLTRAHKTKAAELLG